MTDVIVPDTTPTDETVNLGPEGLRMLIGAVVRLTVGRLTHDAGTKAVVCGTRDEGRYQLELVVPGFPIKFWMTLDEVKILQPPRQDWWRLLEDANV